MAEKLGLKVATEIMTPPGSVDVSTEVIKLRRADPDYTIFHGYVLAPIPEFVGQGKRMGLKTQYMGTFWTMDNSTVMQMGEDAEGFMGVMPYRYYDQAADAPMLKKIREMRPQYQSTGYMGLPGRHAVHRGGQAHAGRGQRPERGQHEGGAGRHQGL